ncbi:MAG: hypothetical protein A2X67_13195 [Ignavibacteria bacterium GWA2_55_11]|nr:MAG: hypothetical protein A2X67_13195 [Ignavibacteria bacterium GWA2_55_11]OGU45118.1 MAG: hypothetical protein A2X68_07470 [Ignavibacteria bacterium GWC2_56_12]
MNQSQQLIAQLERQVGPHAKSPMFAQLADAYLAAGRPKDALRVCDAGIANFPFYSTGHLIKGRTLIALKMYSEARREFEVVRDWLPSNPSVRSLLQSVPISDDQVLVAPPEEERAAPVQEAKVEQQAQPEAPQASGDFFGAITGGSTPEAAVDTGTTPEAPPTDNVFGLPSVAPDAGTMTAEPEQSLQPNPEAFAAFGQGGEGFGVPSAAAESGMPSGGLGSGEETFERFAERMRASLGPSGTMSMEEFFAGTNGSGEVSASQAGELMTSEPQAAEPPAAEAVDPFASSGFGGFETAQSEAPPAEQPSAEPFATSDFGGVQTEEPAMEAPASDPFASSDFGATQTQEPEPAPAAPEDASSFAGPDFSGLPEAPASEPAPAEEFGSTPAPEETPPADSGFSGPAFTGPEPVSGSGSIEDIAQKLKSAKKITPVIDFSAKTQSSSASDDTLSSTGFVTPTLAEIYAKQGWYDDAIKAYRTLSRNKPAERERFEQRIAELEELKKQQS